MTGTANYYTLDSSNKFVRNTCTLPAAGQKSDIAVSDVFYGSCGDRDRAGDAAGHAEGLPRSRAGD